MRNRRSMPVLIIGILMSGSGFADDLAQPQLTPATQAFLADLEFEDNSFLNRVSKLRRVSFLTVAEIGETQLFFGVNNKGLLGFHIHAYRHHGKERQLELLRMPYLLDVDKESK